MNYHLIKKDDMNNGEGIRVTLFVSSCSHHCKNCHNPETWDSKSGKLFDKLAEENLFNELQKDYIDGITFSGGDPLNVNNVKEVYGLCKKIKTTFSQKNIWCYTGFTFEECLQDEDKIKILNYIDILVDGKFIQDLADVNYKWAGSTNQRVIDVQKSLQQNKVVLYQI